jgi:uncharacterized protein (TIGR03435 family)
LARFIRVVVPKWELGILWLVGSVWGGLFWCPFGEGAGAMREPGTRGSKSGVGWLVGAGWMWIAVCCCLGQAAPGPVPYVPTMTFDVASVRENKSVDVNAGFTMSGWFQPQTSIFRATNWPIENLITVAYGVDRYQLVGAPKWPNPTLFVIGAKGDSETDAKLAGLTTEQQWAEQKHMLQALLEERFKLKTHWETKEGDVYNLVVAKGGPKLGGGGSVPPSADEVKRFGGRPVPVIHQKNDGRGYDFIAHGCSMEVWAGMLTGQFGRQVIDKTGLTGTYDFVVKYRGRWDRDRDADDLDPMLPMDRALVEELGLKVEPAKGPVKMLVIDHVEMPSEN